jgi:hypothetical protein
MILQISYFNMVLIRRLARGTSGIMRKKLNRLRPCGSYQSPVRTADRLTGVACAMQGQTIAVKVRCNGATKVALLTGRVFSNLLQSLYKRANRCGLSTLLADGAHQINRAAPG